MMVATQVPFVKLGLVPSGPEKNVQPISRLIGAASIPPLLRVRRLSIGTNTAVLSLWKKPDMKMKDRGSSL
jgi:hypothetical protein